MIVFIAGEKFVPIGDKKRVISGGEVMISRMNENGETTRHSAHVRTRYRLAMTAHVTALAAGRRVGPTTDGPVCFAGCEKAQQQECAKQPGRG